MTLTDQGIVKISGWKNIPPSEVILTIPPPVRNITYSIHCWKIVQTVFFLFFLKFLADTCPFLGHWYPCFGFLVTSPLGFKARMGCLIRIAEANVMYVPGDPPLCVTCADLLADGLPPVLSPHTVASRGEVAGIRTRALRISVGQTLYQLS